MILVDSREQANTHIIKHFVAAGVEFCQEPCLDYGDYYDTETGITVERKKNLIEFASNCGKCHQRFKNELERMKAANGKMVILIEQQLELDALDEWVNPRGKVKYRILKSGERKEILPMTGGQIKKICESWLEKYDLKIMFCKKAQAAHKIIEILKGV